MKKPLLTALAAFMLSTSLTAQTLATYGKDTITTAQFLSAYHKNNASGTKDAKAMRQYLDLYIASRLKIKEAKEMGYDTLPQLVADLESLKAQIVPAFLTDEESMQRLVNEAFARSQKDIRLQHFFISAKGDTTAARNKAEAAYKKLLSGSTFAEVAKTYSDDPAAKTNGGDAGYISVFVLPYPLENLLYSTPVGKLSPIYRSEAGYHIFKNGGERKAMGKVKAAQILIAYPPDASKAVKDGAKKKADSIYNRLLKGDDFGKLATAFSNDVVSAASGGVLPEFSAGQYDPAFENAILKMTKAGAVAPPFQTTHGWHIVKYISRSGVPAQKDAGTLQQLKDKVEVSDRVKVAQEALEKNVVAKAGLTLMPFNKNELWQYSDSVLNHRNGSISGIDGTTPLLRIGNKTFTVQEWIQFAPTVLHKNDGTGSRPYDEVWESFVPYAIDEYYKSNMEVFNPAFNAQLKEFEDGNLFFEIMQRKVWGPAQSDTAALLQYYNTHKNKYTWHSSADAVIFYAGDAAKAAAFRNELLKKPASWQSLVAKHAENITADHNRFELVQLPNVTKTAKDGFVSLPLVNKEDGTASFAYVLHVYTQPAQRSFTEAKGMVISDYQAQLEKEWLAQLEKQYPVRVNEAVLKSLIQ